MHRCTSAALRCVAALALTTTLLVPHALSAQSATASALGFWLKFEAMLGELQC